MIRIAITQAAFDAIAATLPLGSVSFENETNERGERLVSLDRAVVNRLFYTAAVMLDRHRHRAIIALEARSATAADA